MVPIFNNQRTIGTHQDVDIIVSGPISIPAYAAFRPFFRPLIISQVRTEDVLHRHTIVDASLCR
jgi:hypothetical protein